MYSVAVPTLPFADCEDTWFDLSSLAFTELHIAGQLSERDII